MRIHDKGIDIRRKKERKPIKEKEEKNPTSKHAKLELKNQQVESR